MVMDERGQLERTSRDRCRSGEIALIGVARLLWETILGTFSSPIYVVGVVGSRDTGLGCRRTFFQSDIQC